jgi:hypothetical protein
MPWPSPPVQWQVPADGIDANFLSLEVEEIFPRFIKFRV